VKILNESRLYDTGRFAWPQRLVTFTYDASGNLTNENRGGLEFFYFPGTLGSFTTVRSATGVKTFDAEYWPYGEIQTETGTNPVWIVTNEFL
jgi:hypothetical protein